MRICNDYDLVLVEFAMTQHGPLYASAFALGSTSARHTTHGKSSLRLISGSNGLALAHGSVLLVAVQPARPIATLGLDELVKHIPRHALHVVIMVLEYLDRFSCHKKGDEVDRAMVTTLKRKVRVWVLKTVGAWVLNVEVGCSVISSP